jgi:6-phosphogluconolactonase/glucosamine-6-phosphate isomerase/deaminase
MDSHFIQTPTAEPLIERLLSTINSALNADKSVVWLLSGGSAIGVAVTVAKQLTDSEHRKNLRILQIDERYGPVGHPDSNWKQTLDAGFSCEGAQCHPILQGLSLPETLSSYTETLQDALNNCQLRVGLLGIGPDGHTAGMLPNSSAANETTQLTATYRGPDYMRITMTTPAIARLDYAIAFASGESKRSTLEKLQKEVPIPTQPAQAIKKAAQWYVYSDVLA